MTAQQIFFSPARALFLLCAIVVLAGAFLHALGFFGAPINFIYSDVLGFYERAAAPGFPYISKSMEYPVLTGLFIEGAARIGGSRVGYYAVSVVALLVFALGATLLLYKCKIASADGRRLRNGALLRYWIFAPSMLVFATYNWDIIAVFFSIAAFYFVTPCRGEGPQTNADRTPMSRKPRLGLAAFFLALGFSAKFYPALYLLPLLLTTTSWRERAKLVGIFALTAFAVNLPFMLTNIDGWSYFFTLNSARNSNPDSIWTLFRYFFPSLTVPQINYFSFALFAAGYLYIARRMFWSSKDRLYSTLVELRSFDDQKLTHTLFFNRCFLATLLFLVTNKIFSPQYILWLLPFFVLLPVARRRQFYVLESANLATFFAILPWFFFGNDIFYFYLASPFVVLRHAALGAMLVSSLRAERSNLILYA